MSTSGYTVNLLESLLKDLEGSDTYNSRGYIEEQLDSARRRVETLEEQWSQTIGQIADIKETLKSIKD